MSEPDGEGFSLTPPDDGGAFPSTACCQRARNASVPATMLAEISTRALRARSRECDTESFTCPATVLMPLPRLTLSDCSLHG